MPPFSSETHHLSRWNSQTRQAILALGSHQAAAMHLAAKAAANVAMFEAAQCGSHGVGRCWRVLGWRFAVPTLG